MSGWDGARVTSSNLGLHSGPDRRNDDGASVPGREGELAPSDALARYSTFLRTFRSGSVYTYREQLIARWRRREFMIVVDLDDLNRSDAQLMSTLQRRPDEQLRLFETAANEVLARLVLEQAAEGGVSRCAMQVLLKSSQLPQSLRSLAAEHVNKLLKVPGIIVSASRVKSKATSILVQCQKCGAQEHLACSGPFSSVAMPFACKSGGTTDAEGKKIDCGSSPFVVIPDGCTYVDEQTLKLQEAPEAVPTGEMPRTVLLAVERCLVDVVSPGVRLSVLGMGRSLFEGGAAKDQMKAAAIRTPFLRVVGIDLESDAAGPGARFSPAEEEELIALSRRPDIHELLANSIAPSISGDYTVDIKKALACQLIGGSRKVLPDGLRLRGDINLLMLGDPSTAKSQFLKFVEKVAPVSVYTSGKGSSAAGLTASVIRDAKKEFYLEGGAMVLADGGICCIDEFDKARMRETDRVAIHEAMEQQTISIAKAGITTVLNSRTSVLAAANPVFGRYDDLKSAAENIDMMSTILSRFDLIFIVRDVRDADRDMGIARHVMGVHMQAHAELGHRKTGAGHALFPGSGSRAAPKPRGGAAAAAETTELDIKLMKRFVTYCRSKCSPRLTAETSRLLSSEYVEIRSATKARADELGGRKHQAVPITVRQLEALVRIAESLAKMRLDGQVQPRDVHEALRLFKVSTMAAANAGAAGASSDLRFLGPEQRSSVQNAETFLKQRIALGSEPANTMRVVEEAIGLGHTDASTRRAIAIMTNRGELQPLFKGRSLKRVR
ncbi:MCM2/3/5 family-domain-containing protein [Pelagophyceae sp. CCMP2097]|nr:MCM2/3/5 family-domain-containing protein [Pelagophyceae sp. CCMP2097]